MTGKSIKPQLPISENIYLPQTEKPNQEMQLKFIAQIRFKQTRFFILVSIDRYNRWSAACLCEALKIFQIGTYLSMVYNKPLDILNREICNI